MICSCTCGISGEMFFDVVEHALPSMLMAVTRSLVDELFVVERKQRASRSGFSNTVISDSRSGVECHAQLNTNTFIRHHLAIDAADLEVLAVVPVEAEPIAAAYPCIDTGA